MQARAAEALCIRVKIPNIPVLAGGIVLLLGGVYFNWVELLPKIGFPLRELSNPWVRADLAMLRGVWIVFATALITSRLVLWKYPDLVGVVAEKLGVSFLTIGRSRFTVPLILSTLVLAKTLLQLGLYWIGYSAYGADDFSRSLNADYWLYYRRFDLGWEGWLGLGGSGWLPFPDYLFSLGLALHRDLYLTPKIVNLVISGIAVIVVYLLGRELFGRVIGCLTAALFTFQPWHVWLGISGMTSDLPSVVVIALFGMFLVRWLRTDEPRALFAAAASLAFGNGLRYENWFFSIVFSLLIVFIAGMYWNRGHLTRRWLTVAVCGLATINALPLVWMVASYLVLGDWLPALHITNGWMVAGMDSANAITTPGVALALNQSPHMAQINMLVLALGAFPIELALSMAGVAVFLKSGRSKTFRQYLVVLVGTCFLFVIAFKGRLPASLVFARYFLPYMVLLLPFGGFLLRRIFTTPGHWRNEAVAAACVIILTIAALDIGRAFNYPAIFPKDAISAGWIVRNLQLAGSVSDRGKILIERATDWGDLAIVAIANRPERFVLMDEVAYQRLSTLGRADRPALTAPRDSEGVRGNSCDDGFQMEACKSSVLREAFSLVILSSPAHVRSFQQTFHAPSWNIGRYHVFDMRPLAPSAAERRELR